MADSTVVGTLRVVLGLDTAKFEGGARKATAAVATFEKSLDQLKSRTAQLTPQAERMVLAFSGTKLLTSANNLVAAVQKLGGAGGIVAGAAKLTATEQQRVNTQVTEAISKYRALGQTAPAAMLALQSATQKAEQPTSFLTTKMIALGSAIGHFASNLALGAIRALVEMGRQAFVTASGLVDLAAKTGENTTSLQRMKFVADQTGVSFDTLTNAAFMLRTRLASGNTSVLKAFEDLRRASGQAGLTTRSSADDILRALSSITDEQERLRLGNVLFGRSFREFASAVNQGYGEMADQATVATEEQLAALDRLSDRWAKFTTNLQNTITANIGTLAQWGEAIEMAIREGGIFQSTAAAIERARQLMDLGLVGARTKDIALPPEVARSAEDYAKRLAEVRAELARLTPEQLRQIKAAKELGEDLSVLENLYGLTTGALALLNTETKKQAELLEHIHPAYLKVFNILTLLAPAIDANNASMRISNDLYNHGLDGARELREELEKLNEELRKGGMAPFDFSAHTSGNASQEAADITKAQIDAVREQWRQAMDDIRQRLTMSISDALGDALVGLISFKDAFISIWYSIRRAFSNVLATMLDNFIEGFLKGMLRAIGAAKLGEAIGNALLGGATGAAIGGGAAAAGGAGAGAAGAGGAGAGAGGFLANPAFWTNPWTIGVGGGIALGLAIWKKGLFRGGEEALKVSPRRDQFFSQFGDVQNRGVGGAAHNLAAKLTNITGQFGGGAVFRALQVADTVKEWTAAQSAAIATLVKGGMGRGIKSYQFGGFTPPGVTELALVHGGQFGELHTPMRGPAAAGPSVRSLHVSIHAMDGADVKRVLDANMPRWLSREYSLNEHGTMPTLRRGLDR